ncbi:MAG: alpha/beta hydrolase [Caldilineaceae bacterium]
MPYVDTPRMRFHYRTHGDPTGLPMLLLHGSHGSSRWWEPFLALLPEEIYAVAPDLRGHGRSEQSDDGYAIEAQADDLHALVAALDLHQIDLVGHSSGAAIAMEFALAHPELLSTLVLVDPVPAEGVFTPVDTFDLLEQMRTDRALHAAAIAALMVSFDHEDRPDNRENHAFFAQLVDDAQAMAPAAFTAMASALGRWNRFADVQRLTLPTLICWGDRDTIVDRDATTRTFIAIPGANNLEVLRGSGHSPMIEAPLVLAERIVDFITQDYTEFDAIRASVDEEEFDVNAASDADDQESTP